ncbi:MAG: hypothetical protein AWU57_5012, partial [Marinobacter sp. T13-3]
MQSVGTQIYMAHQIHKTALVM